MAPKSAAAKAALKKELAVPRSWNRKELVAVDKLGHGGQACVYEVRLKAAHSSTAPTFAYREEVLSDNGTVTPEARRKVLDHLSIHGQLRESHFVLPLLAYGFEVRDGKLLMVSIMPLAKGTLLSAEFMAKDGLKKDYRPWMKLWELHFALGVKDVHRLGFSHNDLTAGNLFVMEEKMGDKKVLNLVIGDFGKASKQASAAEKEDDVRLLYSAHVRMQCGAAALEALSVASGSASVKQEVERDSNEKCMLATINDLGVTAERVPLFPYFQGKDSGKQHPQWSLDLEDLPAPYKGHPLTRRPDAKLLAILQEGDGRLRLRKAYAHCDDEVPVQADVAGLLHPYLGRSGFTCAEKEGGQCPVPPRALFNRDNFEAHRHPGTVKAGKKAKAIHKTDIFSAVVATIPTNRPNMVYSRKIVLCEEPSHMRNGRKCWMDVALHNQAGVYHVFKYKDGSRAEDNWMPCDELLHLGQIVEGTHGRLKYEPWIDLFTHAAGKRDLSTKDPLVRHLAYYGITWSEATEHAINAALDAKINEAEKPAMPSALVALLLATSIALASPSLSLCPLATTLLPLALSNGIFSG
ncbi:hypothetical protein AAVH_26878 [Aphelenchoides avenae]|nr:hypothetical protein AAVH_26878 [Aphelenchus avenae]